VFGEAYAAQVQDDLHRVRLLHVLLGFLLISIVGSRVKANQGAASQLHCI
jgi:hypothetical protein